MKRFVCWVLVLVLSVVWAVPAGAGKLGDVSFDDYLTVERIEPEGLEDVVTNFFNMLAGGGIEVGEVTAFTPNEKDGGYAEEIPIDTTISLITYWDVQGGNITKIQLVQERRVNSHNGEYEFFAIMNCLAALLGAIHPSTTIGIELLGIMGKDIDNFDIYDSVTTQYNEILNDDFEYLIFTVTTSETVE